MKVQQRQKQVSKTESLELVLSLLRLSTFQICYLRRFFPANNFSPKKIKSLENVSVQLLTPNCGESRRLIDWVESGAADAIKRQYLKRLYFGISKDEEGKELIEQYQFTLSYSENGAQFKIETTSNGKKRSSQKINVISVEQVRKQWLKMLRILVSLCTSLADVPEQRCIYMKMTYYDHCPEDYEPPFFVALDPNRVGRFSREPFLMPVGNMKTPHHNVHMRCKTLLDGSEELDGYDTDPVMDDESLEGTSLNTQGHQRNTTTTIMQASQDLMNIENTAQKTTSRSRTISDEMENTPSNYNLSSETALYKVLEVCSSQSQVTLSDFRLRLPQLTENQISQCIRQLLGKGVLISSYRQNTYIVESTHEFFKTFHCSSKEEGRILYESSIEAKIARNGKDSERTDSAIKSKESTSKFQNQANFQQNHHLCAESEMKSLTLSSAGPSNENQPMAVLESDHNKFSFLPSSQETLNENGRIRKASFVEDPIMNQQPAAKKPRKKNLSMISRMKA